MKQVFITPLFFLLLVMISAQSAVDKNHVLKDTDHGYAGLEFTNDFIFASVKAADPADQNKCNNRFDPKVEKGLMWLGNVFTGYKWKSNYFELAYVSLWNYGSIYSGSSGSFTSANYYGSLQFRYYYQIPLHSNSFNLLVGPNIGWAFRFPGYGEGTYTYWYNGFELPSPIFQTRSEHLGDSKRNMVLGVNLRCDFKLKKNLTIVTNLNASFLYIERDYFWIYPYPGAPSGSPYEIYYPRNNWNLSLSVGLKFDFYSKKKKQQTYDQLGIENPYKK